MSAHTHYKETTFGFEYGAAKVERLFSHKGAVCVRVGGKHQGVEIYVSKTGRSVRMLKCRVHPHGTPR